MSLSFVPRPYQQRTYEALLASWAAGKRFPCIVAPTGAGKTCMAEMALREAKNGWGVVHTRVLRAQTAKRIPFISVATVQGLLPDGPAAESRRTQIANGDMVWGDEIHHWAGEDWRAAARVVDHITRKFGCTATPQRADGTPLGDICDDLIVAAQYSELLRDGALCPCDVDKPAMTRRQMKKHKVKPDPVKAYLKQGRRDDGSFRPGILFAPTISKCEEFVSELKEAGVRAELVCCDTNEEERQAIFDAYSRGELDLLASPMALAEGFDAARAEVCVLARMAQHLGTYLQMCGRVLRPYGLAQIGAAVDYWFRRGFELHPSAQIPKFRALLIDCTDAASVHGNPTDDRRYSLTGRGIENAEDETKPPEDEEKDEPIELTPEELIEMEFTRIRQSFADTIGELQARAKERGYRDAWVYHRIKERFGIELPRTYDSKYASICTVCRHRVQKGERIYWMPGADSNGGKAHVKHPDCYIQSLPRDVLELVKAAQA